jgi:hypothetical protein
MPNVVDNEDLYNVILLAGKTSPGKVTLSGHNRKVVWDVQLSPFMNGATTRFKAIPPIEFTASFYLVKDVAQGLDDYAAWDAFLPIINSTIANPRAPKALDIYHPDLAENDIKSIVKGEVGGKVYDGKGGATIVVKFQEYRPPRKWEGTPKSTPKNDPNAAAKAEVSRLTAQYQQTPWG